MDNSINVKIDNQSVGILTKENNEYIFSYINNNIDEQHYVSLTMPVRAKSYLNTQLHPIFEMHLPEGYLLSIIKKHFTKITETDDFGLLKIMSKSITGRISYQNKHVAQKTYFLDDLLHPSNPKLFDELVTLFALNSPLSGVQPKVLATIKDKATLKLSDYIVKSWGEEYPQLALNEYYCMMIAKKAGVTVPQFYLSDDDKLFILERFDLKADGSPLGFEDMCVLQAKQREQKYYGSYEQIAKTIKIFVTPKNKKQSLQQFFKMVVINNLVQNGDAHLKNFGLIYENINNIKLAPAYDIVCTTAYIKNDIPALTLLGSKKWWNKKYLIRFGIESCSLTLKESMTILTECNLAQQEIINEICSRKKHETSKEKLIILDQMLSIFLSAQQSLS